MSHPPYRALSFGLRLVSGLVAAAGVLVIVANQSLIMRVLMHPPASEVSTLLLVMLKELGGVMLMISTLLFLAARDPARNVAILDGLIVGLCVLGVTAVLSARMLGGLYPPYMIWGKAVVRLALAALLIYVRPRGGTMPQ
jgi:hypothetical protein